MQASGQISRLRYIDATLYQAFLHEHAYHKAIAYGLSRNHTTGICSSPQPQLSAPLKLTDKIRQDLASTPSLARDSSQWQRATFRPCPQSGKSLFKSSEVRLRMRPGMRLLRNEGRQTSLFRFQGHRPPSGPEAASSSRVCS